MRRDYAAQLPRFSELRLLPSRQDRMEEFVSRWWGAFGGEHASWVGFYEDRPGQPDAERLVLMARLPKPACSPIGLHGACGRALRSGAPLVVRDVAELGAGYIACDPADRSELVVPCRNPNGAVWGVLDIDSHQVGSFDDSDAAGCSALLRAAGLCASTSA
jgi:putative methionine-R-sulfoxide reductase with GAF domain